ncbi:hypothetical protein BaRGS_00006948 [Batillaria attramentaria]|uniref:Uncharacterized protein n=1 Tax=Batillaria attramentaria TaxID=370345 RepID=A0ABD0LR81_9CAEN
MSTARRKREKKVLNFLQQRQSSGGQQFKTDDPKSFSTAGITVPTVTRSKVHLDSVGLTSRQQRYRQVCVCYLVPFDFSTYRIVGNYLLKDYHDT